LLAIFVRHQIVRRLREKKSFFCLVNKEKVESHNINGRKSKEQSSEEFSVQ